MYLIYRKPVNSRLNGRLAKGDANNLNNSRNEALRKQIGCFKR